MPAFDAGHLWLIVLAFFSSTLTAVIGMGGGTLLISFMPLFLPVGAIVPVHGVVQLASNASRALFGYRQIVWRIFRPFLAGACIGTLLGSQFIVTLPSRYIPIILGGFILLVTWAPRIGVSRHLPGKFLTLGAVQGFLTLFVGATGPLNPPFLLREGLNRDGLVVTQAILMTSIHAIKVLTFGFLGFVFRPYTFLVAGMIISVSLGSMVGTRLRHRLPEKLFKNIFRGVVSILALKMILKAILS